MKKTPQPTQSAPNGLRIDQQAEGRTYQGRLSTVAVAVLALAVIALAAIAAILLSVHPELLSALRS